MLALKLNSPDWGRLKDAYGTADQIPQILAGLESGNEEALNELFGRICHQMSIYSSSIAAFPHLVTIASKLEAKPGLQAETLCLAGAICESRDFEQELCRSEFADAARAALPGAISLTKAALSKVTDPHTGIYLISSLAALNQMRALARVAQGFSDEEFTLECPSCSDYLYVWPCPDGLFVAAEDPVTFKQTKRTLVFRGLSDRSNRKEDFLWLDRECANAPSLADVRNTIPFLFGEASCPKCDYMFPLFDELIVQAS